MRKTTVFDFDNVRQLALQYVPKFETKKFINLNETDRARIGFYFLVFDLLFGYKSTGEVMSFITDSYFLDIVNDNGKKDTKKKSNVDLGIDAVYVDDENEKVYLFNFKYREQFGKHHEQKHKEVRESETFLNYILNDDEYDRDRDSLKENSPTTLKKIDEIRDVRSSRYQYIFYMISNDNTTTETGSQHISAFRRNYEWLELRTYNLENITNDISIKRQDNKAKIILSKHSVLEHNIAYTGSKSYIAEINLADIVRITCTDNDMKMKIDLDDVSELSQLEIDFDILFDNVRDYLGGTKFNNQITDTLSSESDKFFLYNNGLTITADSLETKPENMNKDVSIILHNFQVVNGGQTLRAIYNYKNKKDANLDNLVNSSVLVRILDTNKNEELTAKISEFTNSQNPIKPVDLRAVDHIQLSLEKSLQLKGIKYLRKRGSGKVQDTDLYMITMEKVGQLLFSYAGYPEKAGNSKSSIFSKHYNKIFNYDKNLPDRIMEQIEYYKQIGEAYSKMEYDYYELKVHYIIFIKRYLHDKSIEECIKYLESWIEEYKPDKETADSRKPLQPKFKDLVESKLKELGVETIEKITINKKSR